MIVLGLAFAGWLPLLNREWRVHQVPAVGLAAAPLLGFLFGLGWTPCTGPDPGRDQHPGAHRGHGRARRVPARRLRARARACPFILAGLAYEKALLAPIGWVRRHQVWVMRAGGADAGRGRRTAAHRLVGQAVTWLQIQLVGTTETARMTHRRSRTRPPEDDRRPGELTFRELLRWIWRQVTSMRTALILLLLLALAAIPGSIIPQEGVDSLKTSNWQADHPKLTPIYERLGLFSVYDSAWFSAIYILLMISLVGCIVPRTFHYWRGIRAKPPAAPSNLTRLPDHATYATTDAPEVVLERARALLKRRRYRLRRDSDGDARSRPSAATCARSAT